MLSGGPRRRGIWHEMTWQDVPTELRRPSLLAPVHLVHHFPRLLTAVRNDRGPFLTSVLTSVLTSETKRLRPPSRSRASTTLMRFAYRQHCCVVTPSRRGTGLPRPWFAAKRSWVEKCAALHHASSTEPRAGRGRQDDPYPIMAGWRCGVGGANFSAWINVISLPPRGRRGLDSGLL